MNNPVTARLSESARMPEAIGLDGGRMPRRSSDISRPPRSRLGPFCRILKDQFNKTRVLNESMAADARRLPTKTVSKPTQLAHQPSGDARSGGVTSSKGAARHRAFDARAESSNKPDPSDSQAAGSDAPESNGNSPDNVKASRLTEQEAREIADTVMTGAASAELTGQSHGKSHAAIGEFAQDAMAEPVESEQMVQDGNTEPVLDVASVKGDPGQPLAAAMSVLQAQTQAVGMTQHATKPAGSGAGEVALLPEAVQVTPGPTGNEIPQTRDDAMPHSGVAPEDGESGVPLWPEVVTDTSRDDAIQAKSTNAVDALIDTKMVRLESDLRTLEARLTTETPRPTKTEVSTQQAQPMLAQNAHERFEQQNVDRMIQSVRSIASHRGGEMQMKLDPPELGVLQVSVRMADGQLSATFTTETAAASSALSNSLQNLKHQLENAGISVDRIQVRQSGETSSGNSSNSQSGGDPSQQRGFEQGQQQSHQDRREAVRQMWRRIALGQVPVDMVA